MKRLRCCAWLACAGLAAVATPASGYAVFASAGATDVSGGSCSQSDSSGAIAAPSAAASVTCPGGAAEAMADLTTASVALFASADSTPTAQMVVSAETEFLDRLTFQVPPAMQGQPFLLGVTFAIDGAITPDATPSSGSLLTSRCIVTDSGFASSFDGLFVDVVPVSGLRTVSGSVEVTPPAYAANVSMRMITSALTEGTVDFLGRGEMRLTLPPGVTYTSDSGVFQAPEPGAAAVAIAACAGLAAVQRRRPDLA